MFPIAYLLLLLVVSPLLLACPPEQRTAQGSPKSMPVEKMTFDISRISAEGLVGPPDGLRSVSYEFCIPASEKLRASVRAINTTIQHYANVRGRVGCKSNHYSGIGDSHNPRWREILLAIARLKYVQRIDESLVE